MTSEQDASKTPALAAPADDSARYRAALAKALELSGDGPLTLETLFPGAQAHGVHQGAFFVEFVEYAELHDCSQRIARNALRAAREFLDERRDVLASSGDDSSEYRKTYAALSSGIATPEQALVYLRSPETQRRLNSSGAGVVRWAELVLELEAISVIRPQIYNAALSDSLDLMGALPDLETTSALKQAASDAGIEYGPVMTAFVTWALKKLSQE